jgi:hypothetical protein
MRERLMRKLCAGPENVGAESRKEFGFGFRL